MCKFAHYMLSGQPGAKMSWDSIFRFHEHFGTFTSKFLQTFSNVACFFFPVTDLKVREHLRM